MSGTSPDGEEIMGNTHAQEFAVMAGEGVITLEQSIAIQLTSNHYPPVPTSMVDPCIKAIEACNEGESDRQIALPEGVFWRLGATSAPAWAIVEGHHLGAWLDDEE
jgi:hypothetical protein